MRNLLFPAWYLPNGTKNASELELEAASSSCEKWGIWCGVFVVLSVVAELIIAWCDPPYETFLKLSIWPDAVIGIGIIGEVLFGMRNSRIQTELRVRSNVKLGAAETKAGEANERAGNAELEAAQLKAQFSWRALAAHQDKLIELLGKKPGKVLIEYLDSDAESASLARQFAIVFRFANWITVSVAGLYGKDLQFGIIVPEPDSRYESASPTSAIREIFSSAGIEFKTGDLPRPYMSTSDERFVNIGGSAARIFIGPKEPRFEPIPTSTTTTASTARE